MNVPGSRSFFYQKLQVTESDFPSEAQLKFPFLATKTILINDADKEVVTFSFQRPNIDGELLCTDGAITFDWLSQGRLWFKATGPAQVRVWAWRL